MKPKLIISSIGSDNPEKYNALTRHVDGKPYGFIMQIEIEFISYGDTSKYFTKNDKLKVGKVWEDIMNGTLKIKSGQ